MCLGETLSCYSITGHWPGNTVDITRASQPRLACLAWRCFLPSLAIEARRLGSTSMRTWLLAKSAHPRSKKPPTPSCVLQTTLQSSSLNLTYHTFNHADAICNLASFEYRSRRRKHSQTSTATTCTQSTRPCSRPAQSFSRPPCSHTILGQSQSLPTWPYP